MARPLLLILSLVLSGAALVLAGCASGPRGGPSVWSGHDGAEAQPPAGLANVPDAEPRVEPFRSGGPNRPYEVLGQTYTPITQDRPFTERGLASWYGRKFHGRRTANGEVYDMYAMTAAHPTLPLPSYVRVRNPANGREVIVRVNDRGPFHAGRIIDLSYTAALRLDLLRGVAPVVLERITFEDIRTGAWRRGAAPVAVAAGAPQAVASADPVRPEPVEGPDDKPRANVDAAAMSDPTAQVEEAAPARALTAAPRGFWIQLGAFRQRDGAEGFQRRVQAELDWLSPSLAVFSDAALFRLQAGPYASRDEARASAERVRDALQLVPVIVERR
jgi:rare lipoprotein A